MSWDPTEYFEVACGSCGAPAVMISTDDPKALAAECWEHGIIATLRFPQSSGASVLADLWKP